MPKLGHAPWLQGDIMQLLHLNDFAGHLNETFMVEIDQMRASFVLVEARPVGNAMAGAMREPFSLLFRNEAAVVFPQRTYNMSNAGMGEFGIFLVPIARDRTGFIYQALFN